MTMGELYFFNYLNSIWISQSGESSYTVIHFVFIWCIHFWPFSILSIAIFAMNTITAGFNEIVSFTTSEFANADI